MQFITGQKYEEPAAKRFVEILLLLAVLLVAAPTTAQPAPSVPSAAPPVSGAPVAPPSCDETWIKQKPGIVTLATEELSAICDSTNEASLVSQVEAACSRHAASFAQARKKLCATFPQIAATPDLDLVARVYRASNAQLSKPTPSATGPAATPPPATQSAHDAKMRAEALGATLPVQVIAQGIGDFLVKRAEQEVSAYATIMFFDKLCKSSARTWLPETCGLLEGLDEGSDPVGLGTLQRTIIHDLERLPENVLPAVFERLSPEEKGIACLLDVGYALAAGIRDTQAITPLLEFDPFNPERLVLQRYAVTSRGPLKNQCTDTWTKLTDAFKDVKPILDEYRNGLDVSTIDSAAAKALAFARTTETTGGPDRALVLQKWIALGEALETVRAAEGSKDSKDATARAVRAAIDLLKALLDGKVKNSDAALDDAAAIALAVTTHDWIEVIAAASNAKTLGPILLCQSKEKTSDTCTLDRKARASLTLVADVAAADSSDSVEAALDRFAEPVGSWRGKYDGFTMNLNGYVGAKLAYEGVSGDAQPGSALAPVLAVGLDLSWELWSTGRLGFFGQVIDVGNVASVRLASEDDPDLTEVEVAPDIEVVQLFSPGLYVMFVPWKAPFVIGLGGNWVPLLRSTADGPESAWHVGGMLSVDVPILELVP